MTLVGVISDTHGLVRPAALAALAGVSRILHAGDVGDPAVLDALRAIAPVTAVRGAWAAALPLTEVVAIAGHTLYILHDLADLDLDPRAAGLSAVIAGHSHVPARRVEDGVLYFNPGSAGPRRFRLPIALGRLRISERGIEDEIVFVGGS